LAIEEKFELSPATFKGTKAILRLQATLRYDVAGNPLLCDRDNLAPKAQHSPLAWGNAPGTDVTKTR
jgi:hypothetical protein